VPKKAAPQGASLLPQAVPGVPGVPVAPPGAMGPKLVAFPRTPPPLSAPVTFVPKALTNSLDMSSANFYPKNTESSVRHHRVQSFSIWTTRPRPDLLAL
jgi:hypothetical protein